MFAAAAIPVAIFKRNTAVDFMGVLGNRIPPLATPLWF
jgi:hypothetical protein